MNEFLNISQESIVPIIVSVTIALSVIGVFNWKSVLKSLNSFMLMLVGKTTNTIDDRLYTLIISHAVIFFTSADFLKHWNRFEIMIADGKLTVEEVEELKVIFLTEIIKQLKNVGVDIYNDGGQELIAEAIEEFTAYIKNNLSGISFLKKPFVLIVINAVAKWVKGYIDGLAHRKSLTKGLNTGRVKISYKNVIKVQ